MTTENKRYIFFTNSRIAKVLKYTVRSISSNSVLKKLDLLQFHCLNTCVSLLNGSISFCHYFILDLLQFHCLNTCVSLLNGSISFYHYFIQSACHGIHHVTQYVANFTESYLSSNCISSGGLNNWILHFFFSIH